MYLLNISVIILSINLSLQNESDKHNEYAKYIIHEEFNDIHNWENFSFSTNKKSTEYAIVSDSNISYLEIISNSSASGLIHKTFFNPNQYPNLSWRWRINNMNAKADPLTKSGDDYPIRLFIMFEDDSADISFWTSIRNSAIRLFYGSDPPESSLCFVWLNIEHEEKYFNNPYSESVKMIPVEIGNHRLGKWLNYEVNIVDLFTEIYKRSCPTKAKIAVMGDMDNTGDSTVAYLDFIRIYHQ
jgi:hypothetical protein